MQAHPSSSRCTSWVHTVGHKPTCDCSGGNQPPFLLSLVIMVIKTLGSSFVICGAEARPVCRCRSGVQGTRAQS